MNQPGHAMEVLFNVWQAVHPGGYSRQQRSGCTVAARGETEGCNNPKRKQEGDTAGGPPLPPTHQGESEEFPL